MNMLLIGGLFVIALLAIIGVVVLVASDHSAPQMQQVNPSTAQEAKMVSDPSNAPRRVVSEQAARSAERSPDLSTEAGTREAAPMMEEQLYELSAQIRILYQQIQDMEHRLKALIELTERFEHAASTYHARALDEKLPMTPLSVE